MKFCQQLSEYLCRLSCTGKELCALAGISAASFSRYKTENGSRSWVLRPLRACAAPWGRLPSKEAMGTLPPTLCGRHLLPARTL